MAYAEANNYMHGASDYKSMTYADYKTKIKPKTEPLCKLNDSVGFNCFLVKHRLGGHVNAYLISIYGD